MSAKLEKLRHRARRRGAVLIESIIVSTVLIICVIGALFFHRLYAAKFRAIREARFQVWQAVNSAGCGGPTIDLHRIMTEAISGIGHGSFAPSGWVRAGVTPGMAGGTTVPSFFGGVSHRNQGNTQSASSHPALGAGSYRLSAVDQVACNEQVASARGDLLSIFGFAAHNVLGVVWGGGKGGGTW
jgi:hypothetical protein